jgi:hypothetical protein
MSTHKDEHQQQIMQMLRTIDELTFDEQIAAWDAAMIDFYIGGHPRPGTFQRFVARCRAAGTQFDADGQWVEA